MKLAKAELAPTDTNLRDEHGSFEDLEIACHASMEDINHREHRGARLRPADMLAYKEHDLLHRIPEQPHTAK